MMNSIYYAGIGSRQTPADVLRVIEALARYEAWRGMILRSGGAPGADAAFERGCDQSNGLKEICLPWRNFNGNSSSIYTPPAHAYTLARTYHPNYDSLTPGAKKLMARNTMQILGLDLRSPVVRVFCWTEKGSGKGGTGQALRIARDYQIPIYDLGAQAVFDFVTDTLCKTGALS